MDPNEVAELSAGSSVNEVRPSQGALDTSPAPMPSPCPTCGGGAGSPVSYIYALGQIETRFPNPSVEKEIAQATGRAETAGQTDRQAFQNLLAQRENRYLARQLCWILTVQGLETYILQPRDPADLDLLIGALRGPPDPVPWISTVIGLRGPIAPAEYCNELMIPIVAFDQIYTFSKDALIEAIPRPERVPAAQFGPAARELFETIMQMTDNAGATDENRALNYLAVRYPTIYARAAEAFAGQLALTSVDVQPSLLSGTHSIVEVIFSFTHRTTGFPEKSFVRVDVTGEFPFLVTKMSPYYDR